MRYLLVNVTLETWGGGRGDLRTMHWFPPGRVFQPGQQYEWKREPHTLGLEGRAHLLKSPRAPPHPPAPPPFPAVNKPPLVMDGEGRGLHHGFNNLRGVACSGI